MEHTTNPTADGALAKASPVGLVVSVRAAALVTWVGVASSLGCRCEDPPPPTHASEPAPSAPIEVVEPPPPAAEPPAPDGVDIAPTLTRQLGSVTASEPTSAVDPGAPATAECPMGCALLDERGQLVLVVPSFDESGAPMALEVVRVNGRELDRRPVSLEGLDEAIGRFTEEGGTPPWSERVARALGGGPYRAAPPLIAARARTIFSIEEYAPLVALRAPFAERWLYAELGASAYRVHLLRADRSVDRLLATMPLEVTACDGDYAERACIAPLAIDEVFTDDARGALVALVHHPVPGDGASRTDVVILPLDDASSLPVAEDEASRRDELARSLRAPGARTTPLEAAEPEPEGVEEQEPEGVEERCLRGCALYREDESVWLVAPTRIERGEVTGASLFVPEGREVEILPASRAATPATLVGEALRTSAAPAREGRALVARQGIASDGGLAVAASVELRAPHVGAQVTIEAEGDEYVVRWIQSSASTEVGRVPAIHRGDRVAAPSLLELYAPPDAGFPVVVFGTAAVREATADEGVAHQGFHLVIEAPPNAEGASRIERGR